MPAAFFQATDPDKTAGLAAAYNDFTRYMSQSTHILSPAAQSAGVQDIKDGFEEIWDAIGGNIPDLRGNITVSSYGTNASDLEIALATIFVLKQKLQQFLPTVTPPGI